MNHARKRRPGSPTAAVLLLLLASAAMTQPESGRKVPKSIGPALLDRVVAVGASLSHGFGNDLPVAGLLDGAIRAEHTPVLNASVGLQFLEAVRFGEEQIDRCLEHRASLVVGIDFLFWYAYGFAFRNKSELSRRRARFKLGLEQLERLACPVVVGDLPDMRGADKRMLNPAQIPSPDVLEALNRELRAWAAKREQVLVVPLAAWASTLKAGQWKVAASADGRFPATVLTPDVALQWDRLHPTRVGTIVLVGRLITRIKAHFGDRASRLRFDVWAALERERKTREQRRAGPPRRGAVK